MVSFMHRIVVPKRDFPLTMLSETLKFAFETQASFITKDILWIIIMQRFWRTVRELNSVLNLLGINNSHFSFWSAKYREY